MLTAADMGEEGLKMAKKVLTYFMDGPLLLLPMKAYFKISMTTARQGTAPQWGESQIIAK